MINKLDKLVERQLEARARYGDTDLDLAMTYTSQLGEALLTMSDLIKKMMKKALAARIGQPGLEQTSEDRALMCMVDEIKVLIGALNNGAMKQGLLIGLLRSPDFPDGHDKSEPEVEVVGVAP